MADRLSRRTVLALAAAAGAAPAAFAQGQAAVLPIESDDPLLVAPVKIEGRTVWAVLDNGAPYTTAAMAYADRARPDPQGPYRRLSLPIEMGPALTMTAKSLGDLTDLSNLRERPISALIGMELFGRRPVELDFTARRLVVAAPDAGWAPPAGARAVDLTRVVDTKHLARIDIEDGPALDAQVDLGCAAAVLISPALAERRGLTGARTPSTRIASGLGPRGRRVNFLTRTGSLSRLSFAGRTFADVPFVVGDLPDTRGGVEALLGLPLLRRFDVSMDLAADRMWVRDTARAGEPFARNLTGLQLSSAAAGLRVAHVAQASPAQAAGFAEGDIVTAIDGAPADPRALRAVRAGQALSITLAGGVVRTLVAARFD